MWCIAGREERLSSARCGDKSGWDSRDSTYADRRGAEESAVHCLVCLWSFQWEGGC